MMEEGVIVAVDAVELDVDFCEELVSDEREKIDDGVEAAVVVFAPKTDELCDATPPIKYKDFYLKLKINGIQMREHTIILLTNDHKTNY